MLPRLRLRVGAVLVAALAGAVLVPMPIAQAAPPASAPGLTSPDDGATVGANPVFSWAAVSGATTYRVQVSTSDAFTSTTYTVDTPNLHATPTTHLPTGDLYWRVAALNGSELGPFSGVRTLTRNWADAPTLGAPADGATLTYPDEPPLFTWEPLAGANTYTVAIANNPEFTGATTYSTPNTSFSPTTPRTADQPFYWRVQGVSGGLNSAWSSVRSFTVSWPATPTLLEPVNDATIVLQNARLRWTPIAGATSYQLQVSPNGDWANNLYLDATVKGTSYTMSPTLPNASYFWRVQALDGTVYATSNRGGWSAEWQFTKGMITKPSLLSPANGSDVAELKFAWSPVPAASHYQINISTDANFASDSVTQECTTNHTAWTPVTTLAPTAPVIPGVCESLLLSSRLTSGPTHYWRVRGVDAASSGNVHPVSVWSNVHSFTYGPALPTLLAPASGATVRTVTLDWAPAVGAKQYVVTVLKDNQAVAATATTDSTSYTVPGLVAADGPFTWYVQSVDNSGQLSAKLGLGSRPSFELDETPPAYAAAPDVIGPLSGHDARDMPLMSWQPVDGAGKYHVYYHPVGAAYDYLLKEVTTTTYTHQRWLAAGDYTFYVVAAAADGTIIATGSPGAFTVTEFPVVVQHAGCSPQPCTPTVADTPTLTWDPVPFASAYRVLIAYDKDFTNPYRRYDVQATTVTPRDSLLDNQAGQAFYWFVVPCWNTTDATNLQCGRNDDTVWPDNAKSFRKVSAPVTLQAPAHDDPADGDTPITGDPTFRWDDYLTTNQALLPPLAPVTQSARLYKLKVSTSADFSGTLVDDVTTDATSYTPYSKTYPDGPLYWRVFAVDDSTNPLTVSATRRVVKNSGASTLVLPASGGSVSGVPYLTWLPRSAAASYDVEIYKNGDLDFSSTNKLGTNYSGNTRMAAWTPLAGLAAGAYAWRVRAVDAGARAGAWSAGRVFNLSAGAPALTAPVEGAEFGSLDAKLFDWEPVSGAVKYTFEMSKSSTFTSPTVTTTVMTAWAPTTKVLDGTWYWRVKALDSASNILSTSSTRMFVQDATVPTVTLTTATTNVPLLGPLNLTFSEAVTGVSASSLALTLTSTGAPVGATVSKPTASSATVTPLAALVPGELYTLTATAGITDLRGNPLVAKTWSLKALTTIDNTSPAFATAWDRDASGYASGGAFVSSAVSGSKVRFTFTGTTATIVGRRAVDGGYADVYLDGVKQATASFYSSSTKYKVAIWTKSGLTNAKHTVDVIAKGTRPTASKGNYVFVDAFKVGTVTYEETSSLVAQSWRKSTSTAASSGSYATATLGGADTSGPYATMRFRGTSVTVRVCKTTSSGKAGIYVDGKLKATVDLYATSTACNATAYTASGLTNSVHTVKVLATGTRRTGAKGYYVNVDGFVVS